MELDIQALFKGLDGEIRQAALDAIRQQVTRDFSWTLRNEVEKIVAEYVTSELGPALKATLAEQHAELVRGGVEAAKAAAAQVGDGLREHLTKKITDAFASSYKIDQLIKGILQ